MSLQPTREDIAQSVRSSPSIWVGLLLVAGALTAVRSLPNMAGYLAVCVVSALLFLAIVRAYDGVPVRAHPAILVSLVVLWIVFAVELALSPSLAALKRAPVFIAFSALFVCVLPAALPRAAIERAIAGLTGVVVLLAIPGALFGRFWIGSLIFPTGRLFIDVPGIDGIFIMKAVFHSPNHVATLSLFGLLAAVHRAIQARKTPTDRVWIWVICAGLAGLGLALTWGRAVFLALACCAVLAIMYHVAGWRVLVVGTVGLVVCAVVGLLVVLVAPEFWRSVGPSLTGRVALWQATLERITERPLTGWGFVSPRQNLDPLLAASDVPGDRPPGSIHNSYLRLFFVGGIVGGLAYLAFMFGALWIALERVRGDEDLWPLVAVIATFVVQVFAGTSIFGLSMVSILFALAVGYGQSPTTERLLSLPTRTSQKQPTPADD